MGCFEAGLSLYATGGIDWITVTIFAILLIGGALSLIFKNPLYFKLQPAVGSLLLAVVLIGSAIVGHPLMTELFDKYRSIMMANEALANALQTQAAIDHFRAVLAAITPTLGYAAVIHASLVVYTAYRSSNILWLFAKASHVVLLPAAMWIHIAIGVI